MGCVAIFFTAIDATARKAAVLVAEVSTTGSFLDD